MTNRTKQQVIAHGHNIRSMVLNAHVNWDDNFGREVIRRSLYDMAMVGADMHGAKVMSMLLYAQADRLVQGDESAPFIQLGAAPPEPAEEEEVAEVVPIPAPPAQVKMKSPFLADLAALAESRTLLASLLLATFFAGIVVGAAG